MERDALGLLLLFTLLCASAALFATAMMPKEDVKNVKKAVKQSIEEAREYLRLKKVTCEKCGRTYWHRWAHLGICKYCNQKIDVCVACGAIIPDGGQRAKNILGDLYRDRLIKVYGR